MLRLSRLNWPRLLYTRRAAVLLGIAAVLSVFTVVVIHSNVEADKLSSSANIAFNTTAAVGSAGMFALLVCMAFFWLRCDPSSKTWRAFWFFVLLLGFPFGSAVAYYALVYLPEVIRRLRNPEEEILSLSAPEQERREDKRIGPFRRSLLIAWGITLVPIVVIILLAKPPPDQLLMLAFIISFFLSVAAVIEAAIHEIVSFYRAGISRPGTSGRLRSPRRSDRG